MTIQFSKYQGTGNDFIIIDNRENNIQLTEQQVENLCHRRFGIGADGLMLLQNMDGYDFEMVYYNADGKEGSLCGNGARCIVQFANDIGIKRSEYKFWAADGEHEAFINDDKWVHLKMSDVNRIQHHHADYMLNTGSPHYIVMVNDAANTDVVQRGKAIRYNEVFKEKGINVNFVQVTDEDDLFVRTYERGVEDETHSCGTGVTAAALVNAHNDRGFNAVNIKTLGGSLRVEFDKVDEQHFENIWLCGPATKVFDGTLNL